MSGMHGLTVGRYGVGYKDDATRAEYELRQGCLTKRQLEILLKMRDEAEELVQEGLEVWVGLERSNGSTVAALLCAGVIHRESEPDDSYQYFTINGTGRALLDAKENE